MKKLTEIGGNLIALGIIAIALIGLYKLSIFLLSL